MFSIHARSSSVAPRLAAKARKSQRSLTPSPPWTWPPMSCSVPGLGEQLDVRARRARGSSGRARRRRPWPARRGRPSRVGQRLAEREAADRVVAGDQAPRHPHRVVGAVVAGGVGAGRAALGVGVRAGQPADRDHRQPVRDLDDVARGPHAVAPRAHVVVDDERRRSCRPSSPAAAASAVLGTLCRQTITDVAGDLALRGRHRAHVVVADEALDRGAEVQRHAALGQRLVDGLGDVGVEHLVQHPRALVDEVDLEAAVAEVARHLDAERRGADDGDAS